MPVLELMGVERLKEALEANEWDGDDDLDDEVNLDDFEADDDEAEGSIGFGIGAAETRDEMAGMKRAIYSGGADEEDEIDDEPAGDKEIEQLQAMMLKMQAVRGKFPEADEVLADDNRYGSRPA
jgi:hypothetical protein